MQLKPEIFRAFLWKLKRLSRGVADTTSERSDDDPKGE